MHVHIGRGGESGLELVTSGGEDEVADENLGAHDCERYGVERSVGT